jgi:hypothetical protein
MMDRIRMKVNAFASVYKQKNLSNTQQIFLGITAPFCFYIKVAISTMYRIIKIKLFTKSYGRDLDLAKEDTYVEIHFYMSVKKGIF